MDSQDTFAALSTPHGESALGVIRCSGPLCPSLITSIFENSSPIPRHSYFSDYKDVTGSRLDQVVYSYFKKDQSYTGDAMLEISCHGNPYILQRVLSDLVKRGCRHAQPGEFTQTAFLNGKMDLSQAEAVIDLIRARSELSLKAASTQLRGGLSRRIEKMVDDLLQIIAELEAYIDFPEEDLPTEGESSPLVRIESLKSEIQQLSETARTGIFLREGVKAIIVGEPNAGKSSLLNRLLGESRAIVSEQPGTTRDYIEASFLVDPYRVNIIDTAGIHKTDNPIEKEGIHKTLEQMALSDLILLTLDASTPPPHFAKEVLDLLIYDKTLVIRNKSDLNKHNETLDFLAHYQYVDVSALEGLGIDRMKTKIREILGKPVVFEQGGVVAVSARHYMALENTFNQLETAVKLLHSQEPAELIASHFRDGLNSLEAIVGKIDNERMLDKLFSSFCIGK